MNKNAVINKNALIKNFSFFMELEILTIFKRTCHVLSFVYMYHKGEEGNPVEFSSDN